MTRPARVRVTGAVRLICAPRRSLPLQGACRGNQGFSLLEVLVAFAILALCLGLLIQIFGRAAHTTTLSGEFSRAAALAEARLNAVGLDVPLETGRYAGEPSNGLNWEIVVEPFVPENLDWEPAVDTFVVTSVVSWDGEGEQGRQVRLSSLRFADSTEFPGEAAEEQLDPRSLR